MEPGTETIRPGRTNGSAIKGFEQLTSARSERSVARGDRLSRGLGWFSVGLGLAQLLAPRQVARFVLGKATDRRTTAMRAVGARELACGLGLLMRDRPVGWAWARVAGDIMDITLLGRSLGARHTDDSRALRSVGAVMGVTLLDVVTGIQLLRRGRQDRAQVQNGIELTKTITVKRNPEEVYRFWRDFGNLPRFMAHLQSVQVLDQRRSRWVARGIAGKEFTWDAEITADRPGEVIAWRSTGKSDVQNEGSVRFRNAPGGRGTEVHLDMAYAPPGGRLGAGLARLFGKSPEQEVDGDLRRFKQVIETGEVTHSDASLHAGRHPARPSARRPFDRKGAGR